MTLAFTIPFENINWLAVLVAALATFFIGALWYTALFGRLWRRLNGYSEEKLKEMAAKRPPPLFFGTLIVCYAVVALITALLVAAFGITGAMNGAMLGALLWILVVAVETTGQMSSDKPMRALAIDAGYQFIYLVMTGAILASWH